MIKIGICDDEPIVCEILKKKVSICLVETNTEAEIECFYSGKELLDNSKKPDILFLDIEMPKLDGIETGKKLRENGKDCKIIVATSRVDRFKEAFHINTFRFITKPFEIDEIREAVISLGGTKKIEVYRNREKYNILCKDIFFIEAVESSIEFILEEGRYRKESSLSELEKELEKATFFRINRQCIVNIDKIEKYEKGNIFIHGYVKRVSQRRKKEFQIAYREHLV